jgi:putative holliday junction resolvase
MGGHGEVVLAFDYGTRRIGLAVGQTLTGTASPAGVLPARDGGPDWQRLGQSLREWAPSRLVVGVPYNMDGSDTVLTATCRAFGDELTRRFGLPVEFVDERLTSVAASGELREARRAGTRTRRVKAEDVDANAARLILETWLRERP